MSRTRQALCVGGCVGFLLAPPAQAQIWDGAGWQPGMFAAVNLYGDCSELAQTDENGIVRLVESDCNSVLPMAQGHVLFNVTERLSMGPAIGVALGDNLVEEVGVSWVIGVTAGDRTFTMGLGLWARPRAQVLQPDFVPGLRAPTLPDGRPMDPRYFSKTTIRTALSFTIDIGGQ